MHCLEAGVHQYSRHKRREVVEAFLVVAERDNVTLKLILQNPQHSEFQVVVDLLAGSPRAGVIRLLLSFLDDPLPPSTALNVLTRRSDLPFVRHLLRKLAREQSALLRQNLKRLAEIPWLERTDLVLQQLDENVQRGLVRLAMSAGIPRAMAFSILEAVLQEGQPGGRCAAAEALADFSGIEANQLALAALDDPDPSVQAAVIVQLRGRRVPGALARLVEMVESPHPAVRQAARRSLAELTFKRYLGSFDALDEEVRRSTGLLVKKVDPQTVPLLQAEMRSLIRSRRLRALAVARTIELAAELQPTVLELLHDDDHLIRAEAALTLAGCPCEATRQALTEALDDRSQAVQEAARESLESVQTALPSAEGRKSEELGAAHE